MKPRSACRCGKAGQTALKKGSVPRTLPILSLKMIGLASGGGDSVAVEEITYRDAKAKNVIGMEDVGIVEDVVVMDFRPDK